MVSAHGHLVPPTASCGEGQHRQGAYAGTEGLTSQWAGRLAQWRGRTWTYVPRGPEPQLGHTLQQLILLRMFPWISPPLNLVLSKCSHLNSKISRLGTFYMNTLVSLTVGSNIVSTA